MIKVLVNDGMHQDGKTRLEEANFQVDTNNIPQDELINRLPEYDAVIVRSATKIRKELIDQCPNLKLIARGGVGMDNIDVEYARSKGIKVMNTPKASSQSVAELVIGHMFSLSRFLHRSYLEMPTSGHSKFKALKKSYAKGQLVRGKTLGIIGFGRIGQELASSAIGMGMNVIAYDIRDGNVDVPILSPMLEGQNVTIPIKISTIETLLSKSDFISIHVPSTDKPILGAAEIAKMKKGVILINTARGGTIDEDALIEGLNSGQVAAAGLDVFVNEPTPRADLLGHPKVACSPHIGASTVEAQRNIGLELADGLRQHFQ